MVVLAISDEVDRLSVGPQLKARVVKVVARGGEVYVQVSLPADAPWEPAVYADPEDKVGPWLSETTPADESLKSGDEVTVIASANYARFTTPADAAAARPSPVWWIVVVLFLTLTGLLISSAVKLSGTDHDPIEASLERTRKLYVWVALFGALFGALIASVPFWVHDQEATPTTRLALVAVGALLFSLGLFLFLRRVRSPLPDRLRQRPQDVLWAHGAQSLRHDAIAAWRSVKVYFQDGSTWALLSYRGEEEDLLQAISARNPQVLLGFTPENRARFQELKQRG